MPLICAGRLVTSTPSAPHPSAALIQVLSGSRFISTGYLIFFPVYSLIYSRTSSFNRKTDQETRPRQCFGGFDPNTPAMRLNRQLAEGQTETRPLCAAQWLILAALA